MKFLDKVKNMFTEEVEEDEVKVEKVKSEVTHVAIESPNSKEEDEDIERFIVHNEVKEKKPVFFDDNDFEDLGLTEKKEEPKKIEEEVQAPKVAYEAHVEEKKVFKPTPIISPVYGVLDKNYHKEDIVDRSDIVKPKEDDFIDSVRNKAYGTLEDELENTLFGSNSILFKKDTKKEDQDPTLEEVNDDVLTDLTDDIGKELDELLIKKEKYVDDIDKKEEKMSDDDLLGFIDSTLYKEGDE